jgi:hypothetical protein
MFGVLNILESPFSNVLLIYVFTSLKVFGELCVCLLIGLPDILYLYHTTFNSLLNIRSLPESCKEATQIGRS